MKQVFLIVLMILAALVPCIAQEQAALGLATWNDSQDTVYYASHATLPFGTQVKVTNLENNKTVTVQIGGRIPANSKFLIEVNSPVADALEIWQDPSAGCRVMIEEVAKAVKKPTLRKFMQKGPALVHLSTAGDLASHPSLGLGSRIRITNMANGRKALATISTRVPSSASRIIEISGTLSRTLGLSGSMIVMIELVDKDAKN